MEDMVNILKNEYQGHLCIASKTDSITYNLSFWVYHGKLYPNIELLGQE